MVLPDDWRCHRGRRPVAHLLVPGLWAVRLAQPSRARQAPGRRDLGAHSVIIVSAVLKLLAERSMGSSSLSPASSNQSNTISRAPQGHAGA
jgi:hypothetical protein